MKLLIIAVLLFASIVHAESPYIQADLYYAEGENGIPPERLSEFMFDLIELYQDEVRVDIGFRVRTMRPAVVARLQDSRMAFELYRSYIKRQRGPALRLGLVPPIKEASKYWLFGYAEQKCGGVAVAAAEERNQSGEDRWTHSVYGVAHELGHALGAAHEATGTCNIMDTAVLYCSQPMHFVKRSKKTIKDCARRL